jgi:hypothetical protein
MGRIVSLVACLSQLYPHDVKLNIRMTRAVCGHQILWLQEYGSKVILDHMRGTLRVLTVSLPTLKPGRITSGNGTHRAKTNQGSRGLSQFHNIFGRSS